MICLFSFATSYTGNDKRSNMALVENKPQSGFTLVEDSLTGLITDNLKQVDLEKGRVIVYFQEVICLITSPHSLSPYNHTPFTVPHYET